MCVRERERMKERERERERERKCVNEEGGVILWSKKRPGRLKWGSTEKSQPLGVRVKYALSNSMIYRWCELERK